jgi:predicted GNAT family N-acyltransferase
VIEVRETRDAVERDAALALRELVFVGEQGVPLSEELDDLDAQATHLVAIADAAVVGTCRLVLDGETVKLSRMVVARDHRRRGIGAALLAKSERLAHQWGARRIVLNAQTRAMGVFVAAGFREYGDQFMDAGIEHMAMARELEADEVTRRRDRDEVSRRRDRA